MYLGKRGVGDVENQKSQNVYVPLGGVHHLADMLPLYILLLEILLIYSPKE